MATKKVSAPAISAPADIAERRPGAPERLDRLDGAAEALIAGADTFFVATAAPESEDLRHGVDVSHRGGKPGFVRIADGVLEIPDYPGNLHFNTLGNLMLDPRAGLTFIDFATGDMLFLSGMAEIQFDGPEVAAFTGAERLWRVRPEAIIRIPAALAVGFAGGETSPNSLATGDWAAADAALAAEADRLAWRPFRVVRVARESSEIRSVWLEPADGRGIAAHRPGQHLPIRLTVAGEPVMRTYTLSSAHDGRAYRLSVKREAEGRASRAIHDLAPGDVIEAQAPRGNFVLEEGTGRPIVMISAGVGITPMLAMVESLLVHEGRNRHTAALRLIHGARDGETLAFGAWLRAKAAAHPGFTPTIALSAPGPGDVLGETHDHEGRIDKALLQSRLPLDDYDVYLCGPPGFMSAIYGTLRDLGIPDARIRFEAFGPANVRRRPDAGTAPAPAEPLPASAPVHFEKTATEATWHPDNGTLLDLAEGAGIDAPFSCRSGSCGTCAT
ncbi:MAG: FAD-binding oxidoreductase, partial [Pseudomonadota bacterium]